MTIICEKLKINEKLQITTTETSITILDLLVMTSKIQYM